MKVQGKVTVKVTSTTPYLKILPEMFDVISVSKHVNKVTWRENLHFTTSHFTFLKWCIYSIHNYRSKFLNKDKFIHDKQPKSENIKKQSLMPA